MPKFLKIFQKKNTKPSAPEPSLKKNTDLAKDATTSPNSNNGSEQTNQIIQKNTNLAFQEAWTQHCKDLNDNEKIAWSFMSAQSVLNVEQSIKDIEALHRERSILGRITDRALTFLRSIESLMAGATIVIQAYPAVSSIVIGVMRVVINAAVNYFEYYEKLTEMMEYLSDLLKTLDVFDRVKNKDPQLHETLVSIYTNILSFCRHARRAYIDPKTQTRVNPFAILAKVQWAPFEEQFGQIRSNLERKTGNLTLVSNAIIMNDTSALKNDMIKRVALDARNARREFLEWVCQADINEMHKIMTRKRYKDTGSWLVQTESFINWAEDTDKCVLWLHGPAGTGKSILASVAINHLKKRGKSTKESVVYAYLRGEDEKTQHMPLRMMSTLVKQLCWEIQNLPDPVIKLYDDFRMNARRPSFDDLEYLFLQCSKCFDRVFVVIDGLDECDEKYRKPILEFVCEIGVQNANVKTFAASRKEMDILRVFRRHNIKSMSSQGGSAQKDLEEFVKYRVASELKHIDSKIQEDVTKTLIENSRGMYLWVDLQLNDLVKVPEPDIRTQLKMLPAELEDTYVLIFRRMATLPQTTKSLLQTCFLWVFNSREKINAMTFIDAISLKLKMSSEETKRYEIKDIEELTSGLLFISRMYWISNVRPIHFSLQEFYMRPSQIHPPELKGLLPDIHTANAKLAVMCLQHLILDTQPHDPFETCLLYCGANFDGYIKDLTTVPEELWNVLDRIFLKEPELMKRILAFKWPSHLYDWPNVACMGNPRSLDPTMFMRCTGLDLVPAIWSRYRDADETPKKYPKDYFFLAALRNLDDILINIISQGININKATRDRWTALHLAIMSSDYEDPYRASPTKPSLSTIKILLDAGADWNFNARHVPSGNSLEECVTPLNSALSHKCFLPIQVIVRHESFNFAVYMKTIPSNHAEYIRYLVEQGADINQRDEYGDTALQIATEDGRYDCVEVLKELGAME